MCVRERTRCFRYFVCNNPFTSLLFGLLHIFKRVFRRAGVASRKGGSRFVPVPRLVQAFVVCTPTPSPIPSMPPPFSLCMPHTSLLLALSTLYLFADSVYSHATYLTFQFPPCVWVQTLLWCFFETEVRSIGKKQTYSNNAPIRIRSCNFPWLWVRGRTFIHPLGGSNDTRTYRISLIYCSFWNKFFLPKNTTKVCTAKFSFLATSACHLETHSMSERKKKTTKKQDWMNSSHQTQSLLSEVLSLCPSQLSDGEVCRQTATVKLQTQWFIL